MAEAELEVRNSLPTAADMNAAVEYAERLAFSGLLPDAYRRQPANVLWAIEYGRMIGLSAMAAITGVNMIKGKPTASAALISGLVRQAGHRLRVGFDADTLTGWAEIVRSDDPDFTFRSVWDLRRAVEAELCEVKDGRPFAVDSKGNTLPWKKFYPSMVKARAITEVTRDGAEEVLFGLHFTPQELGGVDVDEDGEPVYTTAQVADAVVRKAEREMVEAAPRNPIDPDFELAPMPGTASAMPATDPQLTKLVILVKEKRGIEGNDPVNRRLRLEVLGDLLRRKLSTGRDLTLREASDLIERLALEPNYVEDAVVVNDEAAAAEAAKLAATDPESDPDRVESDLRDQIEGAENPAALEGALMRARSAAAAGAIGKAALSLLEQAGKQRTDQLAADHGWSHRALAEQGAAL